jgi:hypothetical protein
MLKLAHFSVKEYLVSPRIQLGRVSQYGISKRLSDTFISQTCLLYLMQFNTRDTLSRRLEPSFPLAQYAATHWATHARSDDGVIPDILEALIARLLSPYGVPFINFALLYELFPTPSMKTRFDPTPYASALGLEKVLRSLLVGEWQAANDSETVNYSLHVASLAGHETVVRLLLENGAAVNAVNGWHGTALGGASEAGHENIVQLLLENGADVNSTEHGPALWWASWAGHEGIVRLLLKHGAEINSVNGGLGTALSRASEVGHENIVQLLLESGADVNSTDTSQRTALWEASWAGHEGIVRLLLKNGAEINAVNGGLGTALIGASKAGHKNIVRLLLENGADNNSTAVTRLTPLMMGGSDPTLRSGLVWKAAASRSIWDVGI